MQVYAWRTPLGLHSHVGAGKMQTLAAAWIQASFEAWDDMEAHSDWRGHS